MRSKEDAFAAWLVLQLIKICAESNGIRRVQSGCGGNDNDNDNEDEDEDETEGVRLRVGEQAVPFRCAMLCIVCIPLPLRIKAKVANFLYL